MQDIRTFRTPDGVDIAYRLVPSAGEVDSSPLFVPALSWLGEDLGPLCAKRSLVLHDVRSRGRSSRVDDLERLSLEQDVADLAALRAHLADQDASFACIDLMGWSYYGALVARFALAHPDKVRRLILIGPSPPRSKPWFGQFLDNLAPRVDLEELQRLDADKRGGLQEREPLVYGRRVHDLFHRAYVVDATVLATMKSDPCVEPNHDTDRVNDQSRRVLEKLGDYDWRDELAALAAPTLIVHGRHDPIPEGGSEEWRSCLPAAELELMEDVGHMPWLESPEAFFGRVERFLS